MIKNNLVHYSGKATVENKKLDSAFVIGKVSLPPRHLSRLISRLTPGVVATMLVFFSSVAIAYDLPDSSELPRMPEAYRNSDYKDMSKRNPYGMSIYDAAETLAEEEYFGAEVVSLEESKRILSERKRNKENQQNKELN